MLLSDKLITGSLWEEVERLEPFPFLIGNIETMDMLTDVKHGNKKLFSKMENKTLEEIAKMLVVMYRKKWLRFVEVSEIDLDIGAGDVRKIVEKVNNEELRTNENEQLQKVSAFNDDELLTDTGNSGTNKDDLTGELNRVLTDTQLNLVNAYNNLSLLEKNNIIDLVLKDVSRLLTLSIY